MRKSTLVTEPRPLRAKAPLPAQRQTNLSRTANQKPSSLSLQPFVEPRESFGLHLAVELVRAVVKTRTVVIRCSGLPVHLAEYAIGSFHLRHGEECVLPVVQHQHRPGHGKTQNLRI